jgi:hypothetical protein
MMAADPRDRPGSAAEVAEAFTRLTLDQPAVAWEPDAPPAAATEHLTGPAEAADATEVVPRRARPRQAPPRQAPPRRPPPAWQPRPDPGQPAPWPWPRSSAREVAAQLPAPSWLGQLDPAQEVSFSGPGAWVAVAAIGALVFVPLCLHAIANFHSNLGMLALLFGLGGLVLCARGQTGVGVGAFVLSALSGHYAAAGGITHPWFRPDLTHFGWRLLFVPSLLAVVFGASKTNEETRVRAAAKAAVAAGTRWFGERAGGEPQLDQLGAIPAACFFAMPEGPCQHVVAAGVRVALISAVTWPTGEFTLGEDGQVLRNGRGFDAGTRELRAVRAEYGRRSKRFPTCRAYVVVHTGSVIGAEPVVRLRIPASDQVDVIAADEFVEIVGGFLAADPYRVDAAVFGPLHAEATRRTS